MLGDSLNLSSFKSLSQSTNELFFYWILFQISKRMKVYLTIPETFVFGYGFERPTLICTDIKTKELCFDDNLSQNGIHEGFVYFKEIAKPNFPIALHKYQSKNFDKCEPVFSVKDCQALWDFSWKSSKCIFLQRYVYTGTVPKLTKSAYSANENTIKAEVLKKNPKIVEKIIQLLPNLKRENSIIKLENRFSIITQKDACTVKEIEAEHSLTWQLNNIVLAIEKYYSSNKNCKVESLEANWLCCKKEYFFISLKGFKIVNVVYKPIPIRHRGNRSICNKDKPYAFRVVARGKKSGCSVSKFHQAQIISKSLNVLNNSNII